MRKVISIMEQSYDSTQDALKHIKIIQETLGKMISELESRAENHDKSKLKSPEKETYDKYIPMLKETKYGTDEYQEIRDAMYKEGLKHHFDVNRHHPEHFENGIKDMTLVDIMEMFCDWYSASLRSDTGFDKGLKMSQKNFKFSEELYQIMLNTYKEYFQK